MLLGLDGVAKVSDVGLARALRGTRLHANASRVTGGGTPHYMSPEQWNDEELTVKSDVYAYAVMLNEMVTWARPWRDEKAHDGIRQKVSEGKRPEPLTDQPMEQEIVLSCWHSDAQARPEMQEIMERMRERVKQVVEEGEEEEHI